MHTISKFSRSIILTLALVMVLSLVMGCAVATFSNSNVINAAVAGEKYDYSKMKFVDSYMPKVDAIKGTPLGYGGINSDGFTDADGGSLGIDNFIYDSTHLTGVKGRTANVTAGAKVYKDWTNGSTYSIQNFGQFAASSYNQWTGRGQGDGLRYHTDNSLYYRRDSVQESRGYMYWMYMYGYIMLPEALTQKGGKITISADTCGYYSKGNEGYKFFSVVAGNGFVNNYNGAGNEAKADTELMRASDIVMNTKTGRTHVASSINSGSVYITTPSNNTTQTATIDIRPGDKYVRVSFVNLFSRYWSHTGIEKDAYGQRISNLNASYTLDNDAPTIGEPTIAASADGKSATISTTITDDLAGVEGVTIEGGESNLVATPMTFDAKTGKATHTVNANGTYTIKAKDHTGKIGEKTVEVKVIDLAAPVLGAVEGADTHTFGVKNVKFNIKDENSVNVTCVNHPEIVVNRVINNQFTFDVTKNDTYTFEAVDTYNNKTTFDIVISNCHIGNMPALGDGVTFVSNGNDNYIDAGESIVVKFTSSSYGKRIIDPVTLGTAKQNHNYGLEAEYTITYTDKVDERIDMNVSAIEVNYSFDGNIGKAKFGEKVAYTATIPADQQFVGWYDDRGILVSTEPTITIYPTRDIVLTSKSVAIDEVMIRFENMAGKTLDVQGYKLNGKTLEDLVASFGAKTVASLPVSPFETFVGWRIMDKSDLKNVVVRTEYAPNKTFTITVDGVAHTVYANDKVSLKEYATAETLGWQMGDKVVSTTRDYEFYAMADMTFTSVKDAAPEATEMTITESTGDMNGTPVIVLSGKTNDDVVYNEVGFLIIAKDITISEATAHNLLAYDSKYALRLHTPSVKMGQNMVILKADAFVGNKVVMYTIDTAGTIRYSAVETIKGGTL